MYNFIWYILLALASTLVFVYTCVRHWSHSLIALYLFMAGVTYSFEFIVLVIFNCYVYEPQLLSNKYYDSILGAMFSDAFTIPMVSVFVAGFRLSFSKMLVPIGVIVIVEWSFVRLGIYQHYSWRYMYTAAGLLIAFYLAKKWLGVLTHSFTSAARFWTLFFIQFALQSTMVFIFGAFFHAYHMHVGLFTNPTRDHLFFCTILSYCLSFMFAFVVWADHKWVWVPLSLVTIWLVLLQLPQWGVLRISPGWNLADLFIQRTIPLPLLFWLNCYLLRPSANQTRA